MELRCPSRILFGILEGGVIEIKCRSQRCGAGQGKVVLHRFSIATGELIETKKYKDPARKETTG